jgi:excisionase family DNA binding protein
MTSQKPLPIPRLLSIAAVALHLGVSVKTVRRLVHEGRLPSLRVGRQIRISEIDLAAFLARSRAT